MKVVFIQPYFKNIWESLGIGYLSSFLKNTTKLSNFVYFNQYFDKDEEILDGCKDADFVAFSGTSPTYLPSIALAKKIKKTSKAKIILGGWHPTGCIAPEKLLDETIDYVVSGEGEAPIRDILFGCGGKVSYGSNLGFDQLYWPDRTLIKNERTIDLCEKMTNGLRVASFQASRGCPFRCLFCSEKSMTGKSKIRVRDPVDVCREIKFVEDTYGINYFKFVDATFDHNDDIVIDFCKEKIKRNIDLPWEIYVHAHIQNEEMFRLLKESNCVQIDVGVESGNDSILKSIGKGVNTSQIERVFYLAEKYKIKRRAFCIIGIPGETIETYKDTDSFIYRIQPDVVGFTLLCPYPGSRIYNSNYDSIDWSNTDEYSNDYWYTDNFTNEELKAIQKYFVAKYSNNICERNKK